MQSKHSKWIAPAVALIVTGILWQWVVQIGWIPSFLLPAPSEIFAAFVEPQTDLWIAFRATTFTTLTGFSMSIFIGALLAVTLSFSETLQLAFYPYAVFFQTVPIVAIAPLLIIWFGYGNPSIIASSFIVSFFPIVASILAGLASTDPALLDLFKLYRATRFQTLKKLSLPFSTPYFFNGLRIGIGLSVIGSVVGEFIGGSGLGSIVEIARKEQRIDKMFAAILLASFLGLTCLLLIDFIGRYAMVKWRGEIKRSLV